MAWQLALAANVLIATSYFVISFVIARGLTRTNQLWSNRLGTATALIFFSCGFGHLLHAEHLLGAPFGGGAHAVDVARASFDWHLIAWDLFTAVVALWYLSLRRHYSKLLEGPEMFDNERRREIEEELTRRALYDGLTGVPNRVLLMERLERALARGLRHDRLSAMLFLDIDRFKLVNDSLGHAAGDELLIAVARRLDECVRAEDTVARIGGDEFTILLETVVSREQAATAAERIIEALGRPFRISGRELHVKPSIGIALGSAADTTPEQLIHRADVAMYRAKDSGARGGYEFFDAGMELQAIDMLAFEQDLAEAESRGELELHYQPKVELTTERVTGVEALLRWRHPRLGLLPPMQFIPLAERAGSIVPIGYWTIQEACRQAAAWRVEHEQAADLVVCVNVSAGQLEDPGLTETVRAALAESELPPEALCIEITEDSAMTNMDRALETLERLKEVGVEIALDDFGIGHSSLGYLQRFPLDFLKIDRSFVAEMVEGEESFAIVRALVALTHTLGAKCIAEGIEYADQLEKLRELGVDIGQGFIFAPALPPDEAGEMLASGRLEPLGVLSHPAGVPAASNNPAPAIETV